MHYGIIQISTKQDSTEIIEKVANKNREQAMFQLRLDELKKYL